MTHFLPARYYMAACLVLASIILSPVQAQNDSVVTALGTPIPTLTDSAKPTIPPIDPKIDKLLASDTAKFNYAGSDLLLIELAPSTPAAAKLREQTTSTDTLLLVADTSLYEMVIALDKGMLVGTKIAAQPIAAIDSSTAQDKAAQLSNISSSFAPPSGTVGKIDNSGKQVVVKSIITRPANSTAQTPAPNKVYEASPAADIIGKNKLIQRPIVQYEGDASSVAAISKARLSALQTIVPMTYNDIVQSFIDMYVKDKRDQVSRMLPRTDLYFRTFEEALDRHDLPMELKYLPVMESALIPHAKSQNGASGLWQLPYGIAKDYGLDSNDFIDERRDPKLSSESAAMHLKNLYRKYLNWHLVIAAYHCGDGEMNKAIQKAGGIRDYWELATFLPIETQAYVPLFIAATYVMSYYQEYDIPKYDAPYTYYATDTVRIKGKSSLREIAQQIDMALNELQYLNPAIIHDYIPASSKGYPLRLPANKIGVLVAYQNNLKNQKEIILDRTREKQITLPSGNMWHYKTDEFGNKQNNKQVPQSTPSTKSGQNTTKTDLIIAHYVIQKGDNMKRILQMFPGVTARDILRVNNLKSDKFIRDMTLKIPQSNTKIK
ncbi:MAG: transglycosylase SLT domain-containing protein [Sphingobacteriales bacterium]|nr:transglycosylase SLT domain-containing protein [Sphingobacteriales bacterium]